MKAIRVASVVLALWAGVGPVMAEVMVSSPIPRKRPAAEQAASPIAGLSTSGAVAAPLLRPKARAQDQAAAPQQEAGSAVVIEAVAIVQARSPRPKLRPKGLGDEAQVIKAAAVRTQPANESLISRKGSVCGSPAIKGQAVSRVTSRVRGCGIEDPVKVTSIAGVTLSTPATIDCTTAKAIKSWIEGGLQPSFTKNPVVQLQIAGSYTCRPRNNIKGAKISEHGRGKAIDIAGFVLADGTSLSIAGNYRGKNYGKAIKAAHKAACGTFGTTLGPGSDGHHEDHLHFDTANYRNPYCR